MNWTKKRILVWLSWGVDSAVAAALLLEQGYEVIAWFMKNYTDETNPNCHTREDRDMAIKVAAHLGIKTFIIFDFREEYNERIIQYIYNGYQQWLTPNPDVLCNSLVKFDLFLEEAKKLWCDAVATGHYARVEQVWTEFHLLKWVDSNKDQSYFLSWLQQKQLAHALFPLGGMTKPEVRAKALELKLPNADRKDSQWLCFIGKVPMKEFLSKTIPVQPWSIKDSTGKVIGTHPWALFYTIWQREWIGLSGGPRFVLEKDVQKNELVVGHEDDAKLRTSTVFVTDRHWSHHNYALPLNAFTKLRYRQPDQPCVISSSDHKTYKLAFSTLQRAATPGQIAVIYQWDLLIAQWVIL
jgi:tRNA-specific 2-thiouridylase